jgi:hypothetical protein
MRNERFERPGQRIAGLFGRLMLLVLGVALSCVAGEAAIRWLYADSVVLFPATTRALATGSITSGAFDLVRRSCTEA